MIPGRAEAGCAASDEALIEAVESDIAPPAPTPSVESIPVVGEHQKLVTFVIDSVDGWVDSISWGVSDGGETSDSRLWRTLDEGELGFTQTPWVHYAVVPADWDPARGGGFWISSTGFSGSEGNAVRCSVAVDGVEVSYYTPEYYPGSGGVYRYSLTSCTPSTGILRAD